MDAGYGRGEILQSPFVVFIGSVASPPWHSELKLLSTTWGTLLGFSDKKPQSCCQEYNFHRSQLGFAYLGQLIEQFF